MLKFAGLLALMIAGGTPQTARAIPPAAPVWQVSGFDMPESVLRDEKRGVFYVSSIIGSPGEADGAGSISIISADGSVVDRNFVTGLDAPKGMAILNDRLLVADLTRLHVIDLETGLVERSISAPGTRFLNDVVTADGAAYVTDFMADRIYRYRDEELTLWLADPDLSHPNGIGVLDGDLVVGSWGQGMKEDFTTEAPGALLAVDLESGAIDTIVPAIGNIDGIAIAADAIFFSDWVTGGVWQVRGGAKPVKFLDSSPGVADISVYDGILYVPLMLDGIVQAIPAAPADQE